jgi:hypothetical protein
MHRNLKGPFQMAKKAARVWTPKAMCKAMDLDLPESTTVLAERAWAENPINKPIISDPSLAEVISPQFVAVLTTKWWKSDKTTFTFSFMEKVNKETADKIQSLANRWKSSPCNLDFKWTNDVNAADFRLAFADDGYWSYIGVDCRSIARNKPTMNLQGMGTPNFSEKEGLRVIPHEFGHAIGMPHEHTRKAIIDRLDPQKTIRVFRRDQGWNESTVRAQILTPISESALHGATEPDDKSIMCYWFTGECTKDGKPIVGGSDLSPLDKEFASKIWPSTIEPPPPPVEDGGTIKVGGVTYRVKLERMAG